MDFQLRSNVPEHHNLHRPRSNKNIIADSDFTDNDRIDPDPNAIAQNRITFCFSSVCLANRATLVQTHAVAQNRIRVNRDPIWMTKIQELPYVFRVYLNPISFPYRSR